MGKTALTKKMEQEIFNSIHKRSVFCCFEVTIGWYGKERVDMLSYDTNGIFRCFEIKSSIPDFYSKAKKTFIGHYNYYVLTQEVYDKVKEDIPSEIGVYIHGSCVKRPKKCLVADSTLHILKDSMIRSLYRYFEEVVQNKDDSLIKQKNRYIGHLKYERDKYYREYSDLKKKISHMDKGGLRNERKKK